MRKVLIVTLLLGLTTPAVACHLGASEAVYQAMALADWSQTRYFNGHPELGLYETNPILGKHPSAAVINRYFVVMGLAHLAVTCMLHGQARQYWQGATIAFEVYTVDSNINLGVNIKW